MIRHEEKPESQNLSDLDLFDLSIIGMIILSPDGTILASNHVANKLFKDINGLIGKSFKALIYTDPPFELNNLFLKIQQQKAEEEQHRSCLKISFTVTGRRTHGSVLSEKKV